jgi:hypothetical protein
LNREAEAKGRSRAAASLSRLIYRLTVRQGPRVAREKFEDLDAAVAALERHAKDIRSAGPLKERKMLREFEPDVQVAGRVEISTGGVFRRGEDAGVDVMGDGTFVAFRGGIRRTELDPGSRGPFDAVRRALA